MPASSIPIAVVIPAASSLLSAAIRDPQSIVQDCPSRREQIACRSGRWSVNASGGPSHAATGAYLIDGLRGLMSHHVVGDVRGKGLLIGVELVKDRTTKEPGDAAQITAVVDFCRDRGLIVGRSGGGRRFGNTITLCPPLVITRAECDRIVDTLGQALATL